MEKFLYSTISLLILMLLSPLFLIVGIMIKLTSEGPIFFTQMRIGKNNELFKFYKFRTMKIGTPDVSTDKLDNSKGYVTLIGKFLRKSSLDELPQLINILKGNMTFVGPRPALYNQYELKEMRTKAKVHTLLPGVTGWAQINGRDNNDDFKKTVHDVYYLNNKSLALDLKILFRTVFKVIKAEGIIDNELESVNDNEFKSMNANELKSINANGFKSMNDNGFKRINNNVFKRINNNGLKTRRSKDYPA